MRFLLLFIALIIFSCTAFAEDAKFNGHALLYFQEVGAWGWYVSVDQVIDGPTDLVSDNMSVYMTSANPAEYPPGFIDPNIKAGDNVSVYGWLQGNGPEEYHILLVGSDKYYIKPQD
jgi:hypothetical protein